MYTRIAMINNNLQIWRKLRQLVIDSTDCVDGKIQITEHCTIMDKLIDWISVPDDEEEITIKFTYLDSPVQFTVNNLPMDEFRQLAQATYYELKSSYIIGDFEEDFIPMCH